MIRIFLLASVVAVSGCSNLYAPDVTRFMEPEVISTYGVTPPSAAAGSCWAETGNGAQVRAISTLGDDQQVWFERPCDAEMTMYFIETLQRALQVRGLYRREVTGEMDTATRFAVRLYQQPLGLDSGILSLSAARSLGLSSVVIEGEKREATDQTQS